MSEIQATYTVSQELKREGFHVEPYSPGDEAPIIKVTTDREHSPRLLFETVRENSAVAFSIEMVGPQEFMIQFGEEH